MTRLIDRIRALEQQIELEVREVRRLFDDEDAVYAPGMHREQITMLNKQIEERERIVADLKADLVVQAEWTTTQTARALTDRRYADLVLARNGSGGGLVHPNSQPVHAPSQEAPSFAPTKLRCPAQDCGRYLGEVDGYGKLICRSCGAETTYQSRAFRQHHGHIERTRV